MTNARIGLTLRTLLENLLQDIGYAFRILGKSPDFTVAVVLSLALGIGANTAIFSLLDTVMWRMLPVKDPQTLWVIGEGSTYQQYRVMRDNNQVADGCTTPEFSS